MASSLKDDFVAKATTAMHNIANEWIVSGSMSAKDFIKKFYPETDQKQDERTSQFVNKMMEGVQETVISIPDSTKRFLEISLEHPDDEAIQKCLHQLAQPHLAALKEELDKINPSIVDDIVGSK